MKRILEKINLICCGCNNLLDKSLNEYLDMLSKIEFSANCKNKECLYYSGCSDFDDMYYSDCAYTGIMLFFSIYRAEISKTCMYLKLSFNSPYTIMYVCDSVKIDNYSVCLDKIVINLIKPKKIIFNKEFIKIKNRLEKIYLLK